MSATTTLIGNAVADMELRFTNAGKPVGSLTIAVEDRKFDKQTQQWADGNVWFARCTIWGPMAENVAASIVKGTRVVAFGRIEQREFEDKQGNKRTSVEVTVDDLGVSLKNATATVTRKSNSSGSSSGGQSWNPPATAPATDSWAATEPATYEDPTPF